MGAGTDYDRDHDLSLTTTACTRRVVDETPNADDAEKLKKDLTDRLTKSSARLNEVNPRLVAVSLIISENQIRFRDVINAVKITAVAAPLPGK